MCEWHYSEIVIATSLSKKAFFLELKFSTSITTDLLLSFLINNVFLLLFQLSENKENYSTQMIQKTVVVFQGKK